MQELQWKIEGTRFKSEAEYQAALRDKAIIDSITKDKRLDKPEDIEKLYKMLARGDIKFESIVGRQFDDNIYELYERLQSQKKQEKQARELKAKAKLEKKEHKKFSLNKQGKEATKNAPKAEKIDLASFDTDMRKEIVTQMRRRQQRRKHLTIAAALVCICGFAYFGYYYQQTAKAQATYDELAELKGTAVTSGSTSAKKVKVHLTDTELEIPDVLEEYQTLSSMNSDMIGWIKIGDTVIDYPVMQGEDNEFYLNHDFYKEQDKSGSIFMDYQCDILKGCDNIILYGHHMQSGKMFGGLSKYANYSYYEEHPTIEFDTIYEKGTYEIMYVFRSKVFSEEDVTFKYYQFINATSDKEFNSAMNEMAAMSMYDTGVKAHWGDQILTLSTCDYQENNGRFVVVAKKI